MPIYEYQCESCGAVSEYIVFDKNENLQCKACRSSNLKKLMSAHNVSASSVSFPSPEDGDCCGSPNSCGTPGSCCGG